jgi:hypothetical protein
MRSKPVKSLGLILSLSKDEAQIQAFSAAPGRRHAATTALSQANKTTRQAVHREAGCAPSPFHRK